MIYRNPWFPPLTIKTESCWPDPNGHDLVVKVAFGADGHAYLTGREVPFQRGEKGSRYRFRVPKEWVADLFDELQALRIPAGPRFEMGCDGGFTELKIGDDCGAAHYRWWSAPPEGWKGLDSFAQKIISVFEELREFRQTLTDAEIPRFVASLPVVGMSHVPDVRALLEGVEGGTELELVRERENPYDSNAVAVHLIDDEGDTGARIGYIPRQRNAGIAQLMDAGVHFTAKVFELDADRSYPTMEILVFSPDLARLERERNDSEPAPSGKEGNVPKSVEEPPVNGYEAQRLSSLREGGDDALRALSPADVREDILQRLRDYDVAIHTNAEDSYRYLEDDCYVVEVKNPSRDGEPLSLEFAGDFTIFFGGWHTHYGSYLLDYEQHFVVDLKAFLANEMCAVSAYDRNGKWYGANQARPPLAREEGLRPALRCLDLPQEHLAALRHGTVKVRFWSPNLNFDIPIP